MLAQNCPDHAGIRNNGVWIIEVHLQLNNTEEAEAVVQEY
jgi:hypothetical protein